MSTGALVDLSFSVVLVMELEGLVAIGGFVESSVSGMFVTVIG